ncbi:hypothetical protein KP509_25G028200 [Ceratopteris richardii]|uniref:SCP domain-containing protein n=1 Tax=Ceratopteris richardii TaxID=49495 RepID=A0A8T2RRR0_CERRI|nr:hypothetical protein KP509_25G028200 [Ceratopteris richardii]
MVRAVEAPATTLILLQAIKISGDASNEFLRTHNEQRRTVNEVALVWNVTLASYAQQYAEAQRDLHGCALEHSNGPYGENLFWSGSPSAPPAAAVEDWVAEKEFYDFESNTCVQGHECGHYTQVVWRDTLRLGCASVVCNDDMGTFIICSYDPPGNFIGQRPF